VVAGDRAKIAPELEKLSVGAIQLRDFEGNPVKETSASAK
jgi:hypothetical protein